MAKRSEKEVRKEQVADMQTVMGILGGRRLILRLLEDVCGMSKSVMRAPPEDAPIRPEERLIYNAAKQDVAHWLREEAKYAAPVEFERMNLECEAAKIVEAAKVEKPALEGEEEQHGD